MTTPFVVDASVFLNAFNPAEPGSEISKEVLSRLRAQAVPLIAPTLLLPEIAAAISRGQKDPELARRFATTLSGLADLLLVDLGSILAHQAVDIAARYHLRGSDAVYASVAKRFACPLLTLDREQHDRIADLLATYYPAGLLPKL
jgi:predicted nucleic acid-binding protein